MASIYAIPIRDAFKTLGIGVTKGYALVASGELRTYRIGDRRFTTPRALEDFIAERESAEAIRRQ